MAQNAEEITSIYRNGFGEVYKKIFKTSPRSLGTMEKFTDANEQIDNLKMCVENRIKYHFWCSVHQNKYDISSHEHEILISVFMYNKMELIRDLINEFRNKYLQLKETLKKQKEQLTISQVELIKLFKQQEAESQEIVQQEILLDAELETVELSEVFETKRKLIQRPK